jgi:hypothetical protein
MASFSTMAAAEQRCREQVAAGTWVVAHSERDKNGVVKARYIKYMNAAGLSDPARGSWEETDQDNVD